MCTSILKWTAEKFRTPINLAVDDPSGEEKSICTDPECIQSQLEGQESNKCDHVSNTSTDSNKAQYAGPRPPEGSPKGSQRKGKIKHAYKFLCLLCFNSLCL